MKTEFIAEFLNKTSALLSEVKTEQLENLAQRIINVSHNGKKVIIAGNGGSAAMASHVAVDFTKTCDVRAINFNEADLITCFANDYGYENWLEKAIEFYSDQGDLIILISSSGKSKNIINAAKKSLLKNLDLVTFSGFSSSNPLNSMGIQNFHVNSSVYNIIEMVHHTWLLSVNDLIVEIKKNQ
jgi:D-sedoheptulose 7-phosphate isomerase